MKDFIKKVIYFDIVFNLTDIFFSNIHFFEKGHIFKIILSGWELIFLLAYFIYGLFYIGIMKFLSIKIDRFIYDSDALVCYSAFLMRGLDWLTLMVTDYIKHLYWEIPAIIFFVLFFSLLILIIYYFWKYRFEIIISVFITTTIYAFTRLVDNFYSSFYHIQEPSQLLLGLPLLVILALLLIITLLLRHFKLFDFRSRKDKWLESQGMGPYKRYLLKENRNSVQD